MDSNDEEDYMSDALLAKCDDHRPGLVSKEVSRKRDKQKKIKQLNLQNRTKPKHVLESEKREEGLKNVIGSGNKGFAMLTKMGFKPGMTIGKKGGGRAEPIPIEVKAGRSGLGRETEMKRKSAEMTAMRAVMAQKRAKMAERQKVDYRQNFIERQKEKQTEKDYYNSQKVCEQLDSQKGITEPSEGYFWPENRLPNKKKHREDEEGDGLHAYESDEEEEDEEEEEDPPWLDLTVTERLNILTQYLRDTHFYCVWCGTPYNDTQDLADNCPGNTSEDHG